MNIVIYILLCITLLVIISMYCIIIEICSCIKLIMKKLADVDYNLENLQRKVIKYDKRKN